MNDTNPYSPPRVNVSDCVERTPQPRLVRAIRYVAMWNSTSLLLTVVYLLHPAEPTPNFVTDFFLPFDTWTLFGLPLSMIVVAILTKRYHVHVPHFLSVWSFALLLLWTIVISFMAYALLLIWKSEDTMLILAN